MHCSMIGCNWVWLEMIAQRQIEVSHVWLSKRVVGKYISLAKFLWPHLIQILAICFKLKSEYESAKIISEAVEEYKFL